MKSIELENLRPPLLGNLTVILVKVGVGILGKHMLSENRLIVFNYRGVSETRLATANSANSRFDQ